MNANEVESNKGTNLRNPNGNLPDCWTIKLIRILFSRMFILEFRCSSTRIQLSLFLVTIGSWRDNRKGQHFACLL